MKSSEIAFLAALVKLMHGECTYVRTTHVRQVDGDHTLWSSPVVVFRLHEHAGAEECYAWCNNDELGTPSPVVILKSAGIESAAMAVRGYAMGLVSAMAA